MTQNVTVVDHPLVQHKLTLMRRKEASTAEFRKLLREIGLFLGYEALRDLPLGKIQIDTPICTMEAPVLCVDTVSYTHLRAHETVLDLVCRLLLEKKKKKITTEMYEINN
eukprot:TRINITY_DN270_c0_g1_i1.p1 TRINITY_DN270_c0_g1~~TRINITY_DN270_c0_g1_i1.p1  ORF type:complete len:110 (-),score=34.19 TRINITY_DN270_c0_g1_i1:42-371(-)